MTEKKIKIFGHETRFEWYDVRTKFKKILRSLAYSNFTQELFSWLIFGYMKFVYATNKIIFINKEVLISIAAPNKPIILACWHHRLMMAPFVVCQSRKINPLYNFVALSSRHGDGKFVGKIIEKFDMSNIHGSSRHGRKSSRGIDISGFREIFRGLKNGISFGITPDGPRGPNQKINGAIVNIAKISGVPILPFSYSASKHIRLNSWDRLIIPLPFGTLCYNFGELMSVPSDSSEAEIENLKNILEENLNLACAKADEKNPIPN